VRIQVNINQFTKKQCENARTKKVLKIKIDIKVKINNNINEHNNCSE
jgi:hypothetical protein